MNLPCWLEKKLISPEGLADKIAELRAEGLSIATLNGSFDLLHAGHLFILFEAKRQADRLLVALNSDASVHKYKGKSRPLIPLHYRLEMMAAIEWVDYVTWFEEIDPRSLLAKVRPDVHVNGEEYGENCIEASTVREGGGRLHLVKRIPSLATTAIIEKIVKCV